MQEWKTGLISGNFLKTLELPGETAI